MATSTDREAPSASKLCQVAFGSLTTTRVGAQVSIRQLKDKGKYTPLLHLKSDSILSYRKLDSLVDNVSGRAAERKANSRSLFHSMVYTPPEDSTPLEISATMTRLIGSSNTQRKTQGSIVLIPDNSASLINVALLLPSNLGFNADFVTLFSGRAVVYEKDLDIASLLPKLKTNWFFNNRDPDDLSILFDIETIKDGKITTRDIKQKTVFTTQGEVEVIGRSTRKRKLKVPKSN